MAARDYHRDNKSFIIYKDWEQMTGMLSDEDAGKLFKALFAFAARGTGSEDSAELSPVVKMAFCMMSAQIERDGEKWLSVCERNAENARKRKQKSAEKATADDRMPPCTKSADTDKDTDTDTDTDTDKKKDTDTVIEGEGEKEKETDTELLRSDDRAPAPASHTKNNISNKSNEAARSLSDEYGEELAREYLERVWDYCKSTGKTYRDPIAAARRWLRDDIRSGKIKPPSKNSTDSYDDDYGYYNVLDTSCYCEDS